MDFQKYINHNDHIQQFGAYSNNKTNVVIKPRIIKFVGNMQDNIKQLLNDLQCNCGVRKQFYNILMVYANKIQKLRKQREHYKNTLKEYLVTMEHKQINTNLNINRNNTKKSTKFDFTSQVDTYQQNNYKQNIFKTASKTKDILSVVIKQKYQKKQNLKNLTAIKNNKAKFHSQFTNIKNNTVDNKLKYQQQNLKKQINLITQANYNDQGQFSLNLSSFQDGEKETSDFMKEMSSIMSQTNLLDSDLDIQLDEVIGKNILKDDKFQQEQANKLKMIKQSTNLNLLLKNKQNQNIKISLTKEPKKKQTSIIQNILSKDNKLKKIKFSSTSNQQNKQNKKVQSCLQKYNICLEKLEDFIQKKQCLKQLQKTQNLCGGLSAFKTVNSCTLEKNFNQKNIRNMANLHPLQERKFNFNL